MEYWQQVRKDMKVSPIVEGMIDGYSPLFAERYLFHSVEKSVSGVRGITLMTQFGGSRVQQGEREHLRSDFLPTQSLLVPANYATHWYYSGTVDFAIFYFPDHLQGIQASLKALVEAQSEPMSFGDTLVGATALRLINELHKGASADQRFMAMLVEVMLEQTYRVLTTPDTGCINPRHIHFSRLQAALQYINDHLAESLSIDLLSAEAQVSPAHFRRLFNEAMGAPPHRYILARRLERARNLLTMTTMPIARIALNCGFSDQSHLTASFRTAHATTPAEYRAHISRPPSQPQQG